MARPPRNFWSWRLIRIAGIDVSVHLTFVLLVIFLIVKYPASVVFVLLLFLCVLLHELGHALAARLYGVRTRGILLLPIGGIAQLAAAVADVYTPQPGHAVENPVAVAVPQVHTFGARDHARAFFVQRLGIGKRMPVMAAIVLLILAGRPQLAGTTAHCLTFCNECLMTTR